MSSLQQGLPSPCNQVCVLNADAVCIGCGRTSAEIGDWSSANLDEQLRIASHAAQRLEKLNRTAPSFPSPHDDR
ncbi:MAG: DUF1289 domain-containing protein [Oceanococcaceae bacterium]